MNIEKNKSFCVLPWIHLYIDPRGHAAPCCISSYAWSNGILGSSREQSLAELVNSSQMKQLRVDMMNDTRPTSCNACYNSDDLGAASHRLSSNSRHAARIDLSTTKPDGELVDFKMRYFDIRFSNICNFKCRSCGSGFSTMWEQEDRKHNRTIPIISKNNRKEFVQEVIDQISNLDVAYFAGGEPLITEEHYTLLEEMIKQGRTDIALVYNTNLSNINFKDKDLISLWKHFKHAVEVYASIDHYGERAEYIRHGTDWGQIEKNFLIVKETPNIKLQTNTVLSIYNCTTVLEFYQYMYDKNLFRKDDRSNSVYALSVPGFLDVNILPVAYKEKAKDNMKKLIDLTRTINSTSLYPGRTQDKVKSLSDALLWYTEGTTWDQHKERFRSETTRLDGLRGENFAKTFPELAGLMED